MRRARTTGQKTGPSAGRRAGHVARPRCRTAAARQPGFLTLDVIAAIGIVTVMAALFSLGVHAYSRSRHETDARRAAQAAAELELHRLRAGLATAVSDGENVRQIAADLELQTTLAPGRGPWRGFDRVTVVARKRSKRGHWARVELSAYLPRQEPSP